jgi:hypothetical protein
MGIVFYQMLFGKCPFESKSIALLIKLLEKQELHIPHEPKISRTCEQFLRRVLVKDYNHRISWEEIFATYHITDQGELVNKKEPVNGQEGELRATIKGGNKYALKVIIPSSNNNTTTTNSSSTNSNNSTNNTNTSNNFAGSKFGYPTQSPLSANQTLPYTRSSIDGTRDILQSPLLHHKSPLKIN